MSREAPAPLGEPPQLHVWRGGTIPVGSPTGELLSAVDRPEAWRRAPSPSVVAPVTARTAHNSQQRQRRLLLSFGTGRRDLPAPPLLPPPRSSLSCPLLSRPPPSCSPRSSPEAVPEGEGGKEGAHLPPSSLRRASLFLSRNDPRSAIKFILGLPMGGTSPPLPPSSLLWGRGSERQSRSFLILNPRMISKRAPPAKSALLKSKHSSYFLFPGRFTKLTSQRIAT